MARSSSFGITEDESDMSDAVTISTFPACSQLATVEQIRSFELLRLAFFALKLRKLEQRHTIGSSIEDEQDYIFRRNLLQHAIFQQVLSLTSLGARDQALQLIATCADKKYF